MALRDIDHIVFVMLENRSFDQMLGYLSLEETKDPMPTDGLRSSETWQNSFANTADGKVFPLRKLPGATPIHQDPPHGHQSINAQIHTPSAGPGANGMGGFVKTYLQAHKTVTDPGIVMGYYEAEDVPTYDFLARNFCVCDRWFASVPLGTQANRLMAMAGESKVLDNVTGLPNQPLVYDWLNQRKIPWRVYVSGGYAPFFLMMIRWSLRIVRSLALGRGAFRRFSAFKRDWLAADTMPSVIFIEPEYADAPMSDPNDDHPPAGIAQGQEFVREIYQAVTSNTDRWQRTLMIVTYDEHGGFFDHVTPPDCETVIGGTRLETLGPRVPAILVSPHVGKGQVFSETLDHTSVLQLLAERFGDNAPYSHAVETRQKHMGRIASALALHPRAGAAPRMPRRQPSAELAIRAFPPGPKAPDTPNAAAVDAIMRRMAVEHPELISQPGWSETQKYLEMHEPPVPTHRDSSGDVSELP